VKDVPLELLDRYFFAQEDDYVLAQSIRDMVIFLQLIRQRTKKPPRPSRGF